MSLRISSIFGISDFFGLLLTEVFPAQAFFSLRSLIRSIADALLWSPDGGRGGGGGGAGGTQGGAGATDAVDSKSPTETRESHFDPAGNRQINYFKSNIMLRTLYLKTVSLKRIKVT